MTKNRVEALSDGIFATVMTVLVLGLSVPIIAGNPSNIDLEKGLSDLAPNILSYVLSYLILTTIWVSHHNIFHYVTRLNRPLTWLNATFLLTVGFIPFSTTLLGRYSTVQITVIVYGLNIVGVSLSMQAFLYYSIKRNLLVAEGSHAKFIQTIRTRWRIATLIYTGAILLSFINPEFSVIVYVVASAFFVISSSLTVRLPRTHRPAEQTQL